MEIYFIKKYNSTDQSIGYNIVLGGNTTLGFKMPEEAKRRISDSHKGVKFTEVHKNNISKVLKGKCKSEEHKSNLSKSSMRRFNDGKTYKIELYDL